MGRLLGRSLVALLAVSVLVLPRAASAQQGQARPAHFYNRVCALCIGIDRYESNEVSQLHQAEADARSFAEFVTRQYGYASEPLLGPQATKKGIEARLDAYDAALGPNDALILFFAGHGHAFDTTEIVEGIPLRRRVGYLVPQDADLRITRPASEKTAPEEAAIPVDTKRWNDEAIDMTWLVARLERMKTRHVVLIADACCSGFLTKRGGLESPEIAALLTDRSRSILTATTQFEKAREGIFTKHLVEVLGGYARDNQAATVTDVFQQLRPLVSRDPGAGGMTPQMAHVGEGDGEFIFMPLSLDRSEVEQLRDAVRTRTFDETHLAAVRGLISRAQKRASRVTRLDDVIGAMEAPNYWYGTTAAESAANWRRVREAFRENASWQDALGFAGLHFCAARGLGEAIQRVDAEEAYRTALAADAIQSRRFAGVGRYLLARCYEFGLGVSKNQVAARRYYEESATAGFLLGRVAVAVWNLEEASDAEQVARSRQVLEDAASQSPTAALVLAEAYAGGTRPGLPPDPARALKYYRLAADHGSAAASFALYTLYCGGQSGDDRKRASEFLSKAAQAGDRRAQLALAKELYQQDGFTGRLGYRPNYRDAMNWATLAVAQGEREAHKILAIMYLKGQGVARSMDKAQEHFEQSTNGGREVDTEWWTRFIDLKQQAVLETIK